MHSACGIQLGLCVCLDRGTYTYTELLPPGWNSAQARAINNSEVVVGSGADTDDGLKVFIYSGGVYTVLAPEGWTEAYEYGINDSGVIVGWGAVGTTGNAGTMGKGFIAFPPPAPTSSPPPSPEDEIAQLMDFFDASVVAGTLTGSSPGNSGQSQVNNVEKLLAAAANSIQAGREAKACQDLQKAYDRTNKHLSSKDAVVGAAATELQQHIQGLMDSLECQ